MPAADKPDVDGAAAVDEVSAAEWRDLFSDQEFRDRLRSAAALPRTHAAAGLFLVFRGVGSSLLRYSRVYEHDLETGRSATEELYEDLPELYSDPIIFLMEVHSPEPTAGDSTANFIPSQSDLHGLLSFVSAKGFTQMPLGIWVWPNPDGSLGLFLMQWRGYPSLDQWEAVEAVFESAPPRLDAFAAALDETGIVRATVASADGESGEIADLDFCERFAYELHTYGAPGGGYHSGPAR